jgi:hypothetical protein
MQGLFASDKLARQAAAIVSGLLQGCSPRLSDIAEHMAGTPAANYKAIQRFVRQVDLPALLWRLLPADAPFVIADPTEIKRPHAARTAYVGTLSDGVTRGFWLLLLATPFRGRALPCGLLSYSSRTINAANTSRNLLHLQAFAQLKAVLGDRPLVLDREFSYLELLEYCQAAGIHFVIRLHLGSHPPKFYYDPARVVVLQARRGEPVRYQRVLYKGRVAVNVIGAWRPEFSDPLWVMSDLPAERALALYYQRMKIEETFRDLKGELGLGKLMNRRQDYMEQMAALTLLAYTVGVLVGETLRDMLYHGSAKWRHYSGLFVLLKQAHRLPPRQLNAAIAHAQQAFAVLICPPLRPQPGA